MPISRREWVLASLCWSELLAVREAPSAPQFSILNPGEATQIRALTSAILPETETPGAEQAGAVHFIDAALAGYDSDQLPLYRQGLSDVTARSRQMFPYSTDFAGLSKAEQTPLLKSIEKTEFFAQLRKHTILAYFGNPQFGWKAMGRDRAMHFEPPFGFYDAEIRAE